ncbi:MAG TPA: cation diffusion facilitator family transporter [Symbiobacteriaceae bacterium]|nr:cation diffusion facilitator family transporter [Symbiobacteriaceae bacterium]
MSANLAPAERAAIARRASLLTILINVVLTVARVIAGLASGSTAVLADAANSGTDIFASLVVLGGSQIAARPPDEDHQFGHEKAEAVAAKVVGLLVMGTGIATGVGALQALRGGEFSPIGPAAIWVSLGAVVVKEVLARFLTSVGRRVENQALIADAQNQRGDVFASGAALVGALGGAFGLPILDPVMALVVAILILRMGVTLYIGSINTLMDPAPPAAVTQQIERIIRGAEGVQALDGIRSRQVGGSIYVECKIGVDGHLTVDEGHQIAGRVRRLLREQMDVRDAIVHVNPYQPQRARGEP